MVRSILTLQNTGTDLYYTVFEWKEKECMNRLNIQADNLQLRLP